MPPAHLPIFTYEFWWTPITAIYLHGSLLHSFFFNMMWVRQLGPVVEELFGPFRLFAIFTIAGFTGFLASTLAGHELTLGASGSIFGLLAAAIAYGRRAGSQLFTRQFLQWAVLLFIMGFVMPGVDNWAHGGGFVGGYAAGVCLQPQLGARGLGGVSGRWFVSAGHGRCVRLAVYRRVSLAASCPKNSSRSSIAKAVP